MFATILGLSGNTIGYILSAGLVLWFLKEVFKEVFKAANSPVGRGLWYLFWRGR